MFEDDVWRYLPLGPLTTVLVALVGLGLLVTAGLRSSTTTRRLAALLLVVTTLAILALTLGGQAISRGGDLNLRPGEGIRRELANINQALGLVNVLGNIVLFVPLGWLVTTLALYAPRVRLWVGLLRGTLAGFGLSLLIETLQYLIGRAADVDDVLLNTAGAILGAACGLLLSQIRRRVPARANLPR